MTHRPHDTRPPTELPTLATLVPQPAESPALPDDRHRPVGSVARSTRHTLAGGRP